MRACQAGKLLARCQGTPSSGLPVHIRNQAGHYPSLKSRENRPAIGGSLLGLEISLAAQEKYAPTASAGAACAKKVFRNLPNALA
jgi:hypothetical protein